MPNELECPANYKQAERPIEQIRKEDGKGQYSQRQDNGRNAQLVTELVGRMLMALGIFFNPQIPAFAKKSIHRNILFASFSKHGRYLEYRINC